MVPPPWLESRRTTFAKCSAQKMRGSATMRVSDSSSSSWLVHPMRWHIGVYRGKSTKAMGLKYQIMQVGRSRVTMGDILKRPDISYRPFTLPAGRSSQWPTVVVESGYSLRAPPTFDRWLTSGSAAREDWLKLQLSFPSSCEVQGF
ncbi:hypothetical protein BDW62DRAFT_176173 [Aspergillus aurantiobrunneus]